MLARTIDAPAAATSSGCSALIVALVPTGMNCGVSTTPWGSVRRPEPGAGGAIGGRRDEELERGGAGHVSDG